MCCLFCGGSEKVYTPSKNIEIVCSGSVQMLLDADQDDLQRALKKAEFLGMARKVTALHMFIEEENDEQRTIPRKLERDNDRTRTLRFVRGQKKQAG